MTQNTKSMIRLPLILAAAVIIIRIILEQLGSPSVVNNIFGVAWFYFLVPVYFALEISKSGTASPYKSLFISLLLFIVYTRIMVMATYMLAWSLQWQAPRFSTDNGGVVGEGVTALQGLLITPITGAFFWVVSGVILGMIIGGITLVIKRKKAPVKV
ncbi:MAG: hypothetical protein DWQ05_04835 [Calditrichaeota bacterium]|nr:MAG: hypothetical protein DWQ05_04835 [Calditrichota bacterium]